MNHWINAAALGAAAMYIPSLFNPGGVFEYRSKKQTEIDELRKDIEQHRRDIERFELDSRVASDVLVALPSMAAEAAFLSETNRRKVKAIDSQIADKLAKIKILSAEIGSERQVHDELLKERYNHLYSDTDKAEYEAKLDGVVKHARTQLDQKDKEIKILQETVKSLGRKLNNARKRLNKKTK